MDYGLIIGLLFFIFIAFLAIGGWDVIMDRINRRLDRTFLDGDRMRQRVSNALEARKTREHDFNRKKDR